MNTTQNSKRSTKNFVLWVVIYFFKHSNEMINILSSMAQMSIVCVKVNMPSHHFLSLPQSASPTLTMPLKGFVTARTTVFPGKLDTPAPAESVLSATSLESFTAWIGAAKRDPTATTGTQREEEITVNALRIFFFRLQFCRFCLCRFQTFLIPLKILSKI